jgi:hypothetical protein
MTQTGKKELILLMMNMIKIWTNNDMKMKMSMNILIMMTKLILNNQHQKMISLQKKCQHLRIRVILRRTMSSERIAKPLSRHETRIREVISDSITDKYTYDLYGSK